MDSSLFWNETRFCLTDGHGNLMKALKPEISGVTCLSSVFLAGYFLN